MGPTEDVNTVVSRVEEKLDAALEKLDQVIQYLTEETEEEDSAAPVASGPTPESPTPPEAPAVPDAPVTPEVPETPAALAEGEASEAPVTNEQGNPVTDPNAPR